MRIPLLLLFLCLSGAPRGLRAQVPDQPYPDRTGIPVPFTWDLTRLFADEAAWDAERARLEGHLAGYQALEREAGRTGAGLLAALRFDAELRSRVDRVMLYSQLKADLDQRSQEAAAGTQRAGALGARVQAAGAFLPGLVAGLTDAELARFMNEEPELRPFRHMLDHLRRRKAVPRDQEALAAKVEDLADGSYTSYVALTGQEMTFEKVKDPQGREVEANVSAWYKSNFSPDGAFRQRMREAFLRPFAARQATIASFLATDVQGYEMAAKLRGYPSAREASVDRYAIPVAVYDNLLASASANTAPLHRWLALKAKRMNVARLRPCDLSAPAFGSGEGSYGFDAARAAILASVAPLGEAYGKALATSFTDRSIDLCDTPQKRPGCSSQGAYGVKPYVRMHYTNQFMDRVTLTHELGHQMHTWLIYQNQPYDYSKYPPFKSEVTSLVHEGLLFDHLLANAKSAQEKRALLEAYLNNLQWMFYDSAVWGAHEKAIHDLALAGNPITAPVLTERFAALQRATYGPILEPGPLDGALWATNYMVFYNFYTWQYASSYTAAEAIVARIKTGGQAAAEAYLDFLKAGSSGYPVDQLKALGVDLTLPGAFDAVPKRMNALLDQLEALM